MRYTIDYIYLNLLLNNFNFAKFVKKLKSQSIETEQLQVKLVFVML